MISRAAILKAAEKIKARKGCDDADALRLAEKWAAEKNATAAAPAKPPLSRASCRRRRKPRASVRRVVVAIRVLAPPSRRIARTNASTGEAPAIGNGRVNVATIKPQS